MVLEKDDENGARTALAQNVPGKKRVRQLKKKHAQIAISVGRAISVQLICNWRVVPGADANGQWSQ